MIARAHKILLPALKHCQHTIGSINRFYIGLLNSFIYGFVQAETPTLVYFQ